MSEEDQGAEVSGSTAGHPQVRKGKAFGHRLRMRDVEVGDAEFILGLRTDAQKGKHLSPTSPDLVAQQRYLEGYRSATDQAYFIIETNDGTPVGTVRIYDPQGDSFCWGSWIIADGAPKSSAVESTLMIYRYGLELGFNRAHFDVRKANERVWQYHERCGAERVRETEIDYFYVIEKAAIEDLLLRYQSRIPEGVKVELES